MIPCVPDLVATDGVRLAYHVVGEGTPIICLPGGPMQSSEYLGDLGGLADRARLILADYRGTGDSQAAEDQESYRCDRLVDDVEALRQHLSLDQAVLLGHSAGANVVVQYAARHPERVDRLVLVSPSTYAVGIVATAKMRREIVRLRRDERWFGSSSAAFESIAAGQATDADWAAMAPFAYGRWDDAARAHHASQTGQKNDEAAAVFGADGAFDPPATRTSLMALDVPVLIVGGELDVSATPRAITEYAEMFADSRLVIQPQACHFPWLDDPAAFTSTVATFVG